MTTIVQFLHPGGEHKAGGPTLGWNPSSNPHRRKFLVADGVCVRGSDRVEGPIAFWGEWEPDSYVQAIHEPIPRGPRFIHHPFLTRRESYRGLQNTDPLVLGGFFYTCCQQHVRNRPSGMQRLEPGSLILFGSSINKEFVVDTVFVTADEGTDHDAQNFGSTLGKIVPVAYFAITLKPWYAESGPACRLYRGATYTSRLNGIFSFFPAVPADGVPRGFRRPAIHLEGVISEAKTQGRKVIQVPPERTHAIWQDVVEQVLNDGQDLWLGVEAALPGPA